MTATPPRVTMILPVHNAGHALTAPLARLLDLARGHELIVVDDGSTDDTGTVVTALVSGLDHVRVLTFAENRGVAAARNLALEHATGDYVWFVDWDDAWDPDFLTTMTRVAGRTDADIVVCRATRNETPDSPGIWLDGSAVPSTRTARQAVQSILTGELRGYLWNKLIRRSVLPPAPFPAMSSQSDFAGLVPVLACASIVAFTPELLYLHLVRPGSITNSGDPDLGNLDRCREVVLRTVTTFGPDRELARGLLVFETAHWLGRANTALRLGSSPRYWGPAVRRSQTRLRLRDLPAVARTHPQLAARALLLRSSGPAYPSLYRMTIRLRQRRRGRPATRVESREVDQCLPTASS